MRIKILTIIGLAVVFTGCKQSSVLEELPRLQTTQPLTDVAVENGMLKFADEAAMERTLSMLLKMNDNELLAWYDSMAFVSQSMAREAALEEFQQLTSLSEYPAFKAKYQGQFLFNDNLDEEDYQPYLAAGRFGYELILNADGNVIVDGAIVNYNYTSFEETMYYRVAHQTPSSADSLLTRISPETKTNQVYVQSGKKKFWAWAVRNGADIYIQVTAQKKNLFGWNDYKTDYYFTFANRDYNATISQNWKYLSPSLMGVSIGDGRWTGEISCNSILSLGTKANVFQMSIADLTVLSRGTAPASGWLHVEI